MDGAELIIINTHIHTHTHTHTHTHLTCTATPLILESPMSQTPSEGDTVTLRCRISTFQDQTAVYSWTRDGTPVPSPTTGEFTLANIQQSQNGVYECSASISVSGVNAPPLTMEVGRAVVTVGGES